MEQHEIRIIRGKLANEFWGYNLELDGGFLHHVGSLVEAESYAEGYAAGLHLGTGRDVTVRIGPDGLSTLRADLSKGEHGIRPAPKEAPSPKQVARIVTRVAELGFTVSEPEVLEFAKTGSMFESGIGESYDEALGDALQQGFDEAGIAI